MPRFKGVLGEDRTLLSHTPLQFARADRCMRYMLTQAEQQRFDGHRCCNETVAARLHRRQAPSLHLTEHVDEARGRVSGERPAIELMLVHSFLQSSLSSPSPLLPSLPSPSPSPADGRQRNRRRRDCLTPGPRYDQWRRNRRWCDWRRRGGGCAVASPSPSPPGRTPLTCCAAPGSGAR